MDLERGLADGIRNGDIASFEEFYKCYYKRLLNYCLMFVAQTDQAEDIVQESFFAVWNKRKEINPEQSLTGFLFRTVRNSCLNSLKQKKVHDKFVEYSLHADSIDELYAIDFNDIGTDDPLQLNLFNEIKQAVSQLPEKRQHVFKLSKLDGLSHKEIAMQLGISVKGVERHITMAHESLRDALKHLKVLILVLLSI